MRALKAAPPSATVRPLARACRGYRPGGPATPARDRSPVQSAIVIAGRTAARSDRADLQSPPARRRPGGTRPAHSRPTTRRARRVAPPAAAMTSVSDSSWRAIRARLGAERQAHRQVALPRRRPRQKEAREVRARQQHQRATIASIACTGLPYRSRNSGRPAADGRKVQRLEGLARGRSDIVLSPAEVLLEPPRSGRRRRPRASRPARGAPSARAISSRRDSSDPSSGTLTSARRPTCSPKNSGGVTPTIVCGTSSIVIVRPRTPGSRAEPAHPVRVTEDDDAVGRRASLVGRPDHVADDRPNARACRSTRP